MSKDTTRISKREGVKYKEYKKGSEKEIRKKGKGLSLHGDVKQRTNDRLG